MSYSVGSFLASPTIQSLSNTDRFLALLWWHHHNGDTDFVSFKQLQEENCLLYSAVNTTKMKKALSADKRTSSKDKGSYLKLPTKTIHELDKEYADLLVGNSGSKKMATNLREELKNITNADTRSFVEETISCLEYDLYRSAVVMSWLAAVHILHNHIISQHLNAFNKEAKRVDAKWKVAKNIGDLGRMKESDFIDRICAISVIDKNIKAELKSCLDRRNGCGHPNALKLGDGTVTHHLEILILNVFKVFV